MFGRDVAAYNAAQIAGRAPGMTRLEDVDSIGSAGKFAAEVAGQQVPQIGSSLVGAGAGAAAGAALGTVTLPVVGTIAGSVLGAGIGALAANLPFFYGQNRERQKEAQSEAGQEVLVNEGAAALYAIPQASLDTLGDLFTASGAGVGVKILAEGSGLLTKRVVVAAGKGAGRGVLVEVPTEIGQSVLERMQADLPIASEDAVKEYIEVGVAAGILGAGMGGAGGGVKEYRADVGAGRGEDEEETDSVAPDEKAALKGTPVNESAGGTGNVADDVAAALASGTGKGDAVRKILEKQAARQAAAAAASTPVATPPVQAAPEPETVPGAAPPVADAEPMAAPAEDITPAGNQAPVSAAGTQTVPVATPSQQAPAVAATDAAPQLTGKQLEDAVVQAIEQERARQMAETPLKPPAPVTTAETAPQAAPEPAPEPAPEAVPEQVAPVAEPEVEAAPQEEVAQEEVAQEPAPKPEKPAPKPEASTGELNKSKIVKDRDRAAANRQKAILDLTPELETLGFKADDVKKMKPGEQIKAISLARQERKANAAHEARQEKLAAEEAAEAAGKKPKRVRKSEAMTEDQHEQRKTDLVVANSGKIETVEEEIAARSAPGDKAKRVLERTEVAKRAKALLDKHTPTKDEDINTIAGMNAIYERLGKILTDARRNKVTVPKRVKDATPNAQAWLASVSTAREKLIDYDKKSAEARKGIRNDILEFLYNESVFREEGDARALREGRKAAGTEVSSKTYDINSDIGLAKADKSLGGYETEIEEREEAESEVLPEEYVIPEPDTRTGDKPRIEAAPAEPDPDAADVVIGDDKTGTFVVEMRRGGKQVLGRNWRKQISSPPKVLKNAPQSQSREPTQAEFDALRDVATANTSVGTLAVQLRGSWLSLADPESTILADLFGINSYRQKLQKKLFKNLARVISKNVGHVKVHIVPDAALDAVGVTAYGIYSPHGDYIVIRESVTHDPVALAYVFMHEGSHAAMYHALALSERMENKTQAMLDLVKDEVVARGGNPEKIYGLTNIQEFVAEALTNPSFQELLAGVVVPRQTLNDLGIVGATSMYIRSVLDWIKSEIVAVFGLHHITKGYGPPKSHTTALEAALKISGELLDLNPKARHHLYTARPDWAAAPLRMEPPKNLDAAKRNVDELMARGVSRAEAVGIAALIDEKLNGEADAESLDALARLFTTPVAVEGQMEAKSDPPVPPEVTKAIKEAESPKGFGNANRLRAFLLRFQTLDYIVRRYRSLFKDDKGYALDDYFDATMEYDPTRRKIEDLHNRDWARVQDFTRKNPVEGKKLLDMIQALLPWNVNIGPNADNSHLKGKHALQARKALPALEKQFAAMGPEAQALLLEISQNYKNTHNDIIRGTVYNILQMVRPRLSNSDVMDLMDRVVDGRLTESDKDLIKDKTLWEALSESDTLRVRKGMYFPANRFGDWVVIHKIDVKSPNFDHFKLTSGKRIPLTHSVDDDVVTFVAGSSERGTKAAFVRAVDAWVADHELHMLSYRNMFKDKQTGELVTAGMQRSDRDYDNAIQVRLQNNGVAFFESPKEAAKYREELKKDLASGRVRDLSEVEARHEHGKLGRVMNRTAHDAIMRAFEKSTKDELTDQQRAHLSAVVDHAILIQMPGNRFEKRLMKRENVVGASREAGRSAAAYGRAAGHHMAGIYTFEKRRKAFERMMKMRRGGAASQVINEIQTREQLVGVDEHMNQVVENLVTIGALDKLASPGNWLLNGMQVTMNTFPILGGRYGNARAAAAIASAYRRIGTHNILAGGLANLGKQAVNFNSFNIDTNNLVASARKALGLKYHDLVDELTRLGDVTDDIGIENAAQLSTNRSATGRALAKVDRIARQMPNAVEVVNRLATAVAAYDLAMRKGKGKQAAIKEAADTVRLTQGRYDAANSPQWMRKPGMLRFFLVFKKFAQLQYQLLGDMTYRSFKGASAKEKKVAAKQLMNLMGMNAVFVGLLALPGSEIVKGVFMILSALGLTDDFEDEQEKIRALLRDATGSESWEEIFSRGLVAKATNMDLTTRMGWQDLVTGFAPRSTELDDMKVYVANLVAGAPGGTVYDWYKAQKLLREGELGKFLELTVPIKLAADVTKAYKGVQQGKMTPTEGVVQSIGFRPLRQAVIGDKIGARIRESSEKKSETNKLIGNYLKAMTKAEVVRATAAIRQYNARLPKDARKIGLKGLEKRRRENVAMYQTR